MRLQIQRRELLLLRSPRGKKSVAAVIATAAVPLTTILMFLKIWQISSFFLEPFADHS